MALGRPQSFGDRYLLGTEQARCRDESGRPHFRFVSTTSRVANAASRSPRCSTIPISRLYRGGDAASRVSSAIAGYRGAPRQPYTDRVDLARCLAPIAEHRGPLPSQVVGNVEACGTFDARRWRYAFCLDQQPDRWAFRLNKKAEVCLAEDAGGSRLVLGIDKWSCLGV